QQVVGLAVLSLLMGGAGGGQVVDQRLLGMGRRTAQQALGIGPVPLGELQQAPGGDLPGAAGAIAPGPGIDPAAGGVDQAHHGAQQGNQQPQRQQEGQTDPDAGFHRHVAPGNQQVTGVFGHRHAEQGGDQQN